MGVCGNPECTLPGGKVERKGMLQCIRCREAYYCSRKCQEASWSSTHKQCCDLRVDLQAKFEAAEKATLEICDKLVVDLQLLSQLS